MQQIKTDIAIVGGGITGLWLLNQLSDKYNVVLIENEALGAGQSLTSQGLLLPRHKEIDGRKGLALKKLWEDSLNGFSDVDLRTVKILAGEQYFMASSRFLAEAKNWLQVQQYRHLKHNAHPHVPFNGNCYTLDAQVLDVRSLLETLAKPVESKIYKADIEEYIHENKRLKALQLHHSGHHIQLEAKAFVFAAGQGNLRALHELDIKMPESKMAKNTLVMLKSVPFSVNGCYILPDLKEVYVSSYPSSEGGYIWYLSGEKLDESFVKDHVKLRTFFDALEESFGKESLKGCLWSYQLIQGYKRSWAEQKRHKIYYHGSCAVVWPANLTLVPLLAEELTLWLDTSLAASKEKINTQQEPLGFTTPNFALYPWENENLNWVRL